MLQLVLGVAGTGKTARIMDEIERRAAEGKYSVLLVPEQFSASAEGRVLRRMGDEKSAFAEVLSFRTLAERILRAEGGLLLPVLDEAARAVLVRRALDMAQAGSVFARQRRSAPFCNLLAQTLAELKTAGASPKQLLDVAEKNGDSKLVEVALIFEAYQQLLQGFAQDPDDRLALAARAKGAYLAQKVMFTDGFDGFTPHEYTLLRQALCCGDGLWVSLCCGGLSEDTPSPGLFMPVRRAARRLTKMAAACKAQVAPPVLLGKHRRPLAVPLKKLNSLLSGAGDVQRPAGTAKVPCEEPAARGITLSDAADEWEEVRAVAAEMRRLALGGESYGKMALVCRDVSAYESVVRRCFEMYDIPLFTDWPLTLEYTAPVAFVRAALLLLRKGLTGDAVLALLKTGLCGYGEDEIAALENYVFTWEPRAAQWREPFTGNPNGLLADMDEWAKAGLDAAEKLRGGVASAVGDFISKGRNNNALDLSKNIYLLMEHFDAAGKVNAIAKEHEYIAGYGEGLCRAWDLTMQLLDRMAALLGEEAVSADEYDELFLVLVRSTDFGQTPQTIECVCLSGADRMRLDEPDYCFVVGLCEGEFPMRVGYSGLLTHSDRDLLVANGIDMPGSFENRVLMEDMFFYRALSSPRRALYLSWPRRRAGAAKSISAALQPIVAALAPPPLGLEMAVLASTPAAAFDLLCRQYRTNTETAAALYAAIEDAGGRWCRALKLLSEVDNRGIFRVKEQSEIESLLGCELSLPATAVQQYFGCKFSYFMERVLNVRPRRKAELSALESGSFVHYVLEKVLLETGAAFASTEEKTLKDIVRRHAGYFIRENLQDNTRRGAARLEQITAAVWGLLCAMRKAAANSDFTVDAVELSIGAQDGAVAPLQIECADGRVVRVSGKIDRVDVFRRDGNTYLCVVDYKTGDKKMDLKEMYHGQSLQMIIYIEALCQNAGGRYPNAAPAGALYLSADPAPISGSRGEGAQNTLKLNGLLLNDDGLLSALDRSGTVLPPATRRGGAGIFAGEEKFSNVRAHTRRLLSRMAEGIYAGDFDARPLVTGTGAPCAWCAYRAACRHEDGQNELRAIAPANVFEPGWDLSAEAACKAEAAGGAVR